LWRIKLVLPRSTLYTTPKAQSHLSKLFSLNKNVFSTASHPRIAQEICRGE
jgi:hypothetical protein